jgi:tetratricopeptide (TPR) repeat protein
MVRLRLEWFVPVCILLAAGCAAIEPVDSAAADRAYGRAKELYQDGDFQAARLAFQTFRSGQTEPDRRAEGYYWEGMCLLAQREFESARGRFEDGLKEKPEGWAKAYLLCALGESLTGLGLFGEAGKSFAVALEESAEDIRLDHVLLRLATCAQREKKWSEAETYLNRLLSELPRSPLADQAKEKLQYSRSRFFTVQVGAFKTQAAALRRTNELKAQGLHPFVSSIERGGGQLHCVCIGRFESWEKANIEMQRIRGQGRIENAIVKP